MNISLQLNSDIDSVYKVYKNSYEFLNTQNETYNKYMESSLSTYVNNSGRMYDIYYNLKNIGSIFLYDFNQFTGIGTFFLYPEYRDIGYGSEIIKILLSNSEYRNDKPYLLSCIKERIAFYDRNGFYYLKPAEVDFLHWMTDKEELTKLDAEVDLDESGIF